MKHLRGLAVLTVFLLAACGGTVGPSPSPSVGPTPRPTPTAVPGDGGTGIGVTDPGVLNPLPPDANDNPLLGRATYLTPKGNLVNQRTANAQLVRAVVNADGSVTADLRWWSGVAPCTELDHVETVTDEDARTIDLKIIEGSFAGDIACIAIAQLSATTVDLGNLTSGTWTISAEGDAPAFPLDVP